MAKEVKPIHTMSDIESAMVPLVAPPPQSDDEQDAGLRPSVYAE